MTIPAEPFEEHYEADEIVPVPVNVKHMPSKKLEGLLTPDDLYPSTLAGSGTIDFQMPTEGWAWDVQRITIATFTAGSVLVYKNSVDDAHLRYAFTQAGTISLSKGTLILRPHDHLIFVAAGIAGGVTPSLGVMKVRREYLLDYLS